jgi:hypothetical protein
MSAGTQQFYSNYSTLPTVLFDDNMDPLVPAPKMYTNINMSNTANNGYYSDGTYWWQVTGGIGLITDTGVCPVG